ncbi:MAG: radical SAM protein [Syntrophotaleaceae bacterium]
MKKTAGKKNVLDGIIVSDYGHDSLSATNALRLKIGDSVGNIQEIHRLLNTIKGAPCSTGEKNIPSWDGAPKLNGIFLLSFLNKRKYSFELINNYKLEQEKVKILAEMNPKFVLISTTFIYRKIDLLKLAKELRETFKNSVIIVGGPFVYSSFLLMEKARIGGYQTAIASKDYLFLEIDEEPLVDFYVISPRGEHVLLELMRRVEDGGDFRGLPNIAQYKDGKYCFSDFQSENCSGDQLSVDWNCLPESIFSTKVVPVQASNGCTYNCSFCNFTKSKKVNCVKSMDLLFSELRQVQQKGVNYIWFSDDNFRLGKKDLKYFCQRMVDEKIALKWMSFIRASSLTDMDMDLLKKSGCIEVQLGVESGSQEILNNMNKRASPDLYQKVIRGLLSNGIDCSCYFIIGFPGETEKTVAETLQFIKQIEGLDAEGCLSWSIFPFILSPLSPIYEQRERERYSLEGYMHQWQHKTMNSTKAKELIKKIYFGLEKSAPIYRGDNLDLLKIMGPEKKKQFFNKRHFLAKSMLRDKDAFDSNKKIAEVFKFLNDEKS